MKKNDFFSGALVALIAAAIAGCASMTIVGLDNETVSGPAQVRQFGTINPGDITVYAFYRDDSRKKVYLNQSDITFDGSKVGPQTVRFRASGYEASFQTEVMALTGITIASPPANTLLLIGEEQTAWPGLEIRGEWDKMGSGAIPLESCQITGFNKDRIGRQTVSVAYGGQTATFNVEVLGLASIELEKPPSKTEYGFGQSLDPAGTVAQGNYADTDAGSRTFQKSAPGATVSAVSTWTRR